METSAAPQRMGRISSAEKYGGFQRMFVRTKIQVDKSSICSSMAIIEGNFGN